MPDYGFSEPRATAVATYFAALADVSATDEPREAASEEVLARGLRRFALFKCVQCHPTKVGSKPAPGVDPDDLSINLALARTRLRPSWIREFLARPKAIVGKQSRMPAVFYTSDGIPKVKDPDHDIASIAAYLGHMTESPETALARLEATRAREDEEQQIDWTNYDY